MATRAFERLMRLVVAFVVFAPLWPAATSAGAAPAAMAYYTVTDLGALDGSRTVADDINDDGTVTGIAAYPDNVSQGFRWQNGHIQGLGTLGGVNSSGHSINASGTIAGDAYTPDNALHAAVFAPGSTQDLGTLGGKTSYAVGINDRGIIVGISELPTTGQYAAFLYQDGRMSSLGTYQQENIIPVAINNADQVIAFTGSNHAILIDPRNGTTDLGSLGGTNTTPNDINADGTIVGFSATSPAQIPHPHAFKYQNGQISDLGTLPGYKESIASGINDNDVIVGGANDSATGAVTATLFQGGRVLDLNSFIPADSGWKLNFARAINNRGQIVGDGMINGQLRAFLLTPRFPDVAPGSAYFEAITALTERGIVQGYADGRFGPSDLVLRAQSAALIARAAGWDAEEWPDATFPDRGPVDDNLWRNVRTLAHYGVALGYPDGTYDPTGPVLHQQAILFITRALVEKGFWKLADDTAPYPNLPNGTARERDDHRMVATYVREAGAIPDRPLGQPWADWNTPASRGWYAQVLYQALATLPSTQPVP